MNNCFEITFFSDSKYEEITVEITYDSQILCQLNKDKGINEIEIEFFSDAKILSEENPMKFKLSDFLEILNEAVDDLKNS
ncbi:hypothetical protein [Proteus hauseri]|uniref:hypothetical protein n=1 Tax=Proteus hauseri TaxID=183417 RepID=UPI0032DA602C